MAEWRRVPEGFLETVIEMRAYTKVKQMYDAATTPEQIKALPASDLLTLVKINDFEAAARG